MDAAAARCQEAVERVRMQAEIRRLGAEAQRAEEEERRRIGRELHDEAGQSMMVLRLQLEMLERRAPAGIFLVHGGGDGSAKSRKLRKASAVALEKILDASALGKLGLIVIDAGNILELPEEKNADPHTSHFSVYKPEQEAARPREVSFAQTRRLT